ncbi:ABC transporter [Companilactobacillus tucceti DSM 20183]|uniref:ABC-type quaternary amine transporter n=1 Tax=Companilactobacillus tucceti DSM 20183 TaxID=1423811 RepID=A0A0R1IYB5_9LACO|nr:ABC transporter ATP-binding protein [Companilactobacillus tucceti]KRK63839.1 ABC transporter [Companilactobacillus tucceti DSM 20183]
MYHLDNISQKKGNTQILRGINLNIDENSIFAILGPSGSGKTTLLNILAGIDRPTDGNFLNEDGQVEKGIMVFQDYRLFPHMTVFQNITFGLKVKKAKNSEIKQRAENIMKTMGISELINRYPDELSGGQQQRVALARALILNPKLLLMDEPFSSLDEALRIEMLDFVKELQRKFQLTIIFVTHYKTEAYMLSNKVAILINGQIMQVDAPKKLESNPQNFDVAKFLGQANFIEGSLSSDNFSSPVYSGKVNVVAEEGKLYLPFSGQLQLDQTDYPAFKGNVVEKKWMGSNLERVTIKINQETVYCDLASESVSENQVYQFYFSKLPVVF